MAEEKKKEKKNNLSVNLVFNAIYQIIAVISPLLLTPKLSRVFQPDYIGLKGYSFSIVYYFAILGVLGLDMYGQRKIALEKYDYEKRNKTFSVIFCTRFLLVLFSTIIYVIYTLFFIKDDFERLVSSMNRKISSDLSIFNCFTNLVCSLFFYIY